jgi:hypothetical protein
MDQERQMFSDGIELVNPSSSPEQVAVIRLERLRIDPLTGKELHHAINPVFESEAEG